jgi:hypothetical protein
MDQTIFIPPVDSIPVGWRAFDRLHRLKVAGLRFFQKQIDRIHPDFEVLERNTHVSG